MRTLHPDSGQKKTAGRCDRRPARSAVSFFYYSCCLGFCGFWSGGCGCAATGVTVAALVLLAANSEDLYFGALTYPCTRSLSTRFPTTCTGCESFSVWIQIGSYKVSFFFVRLLSSTLLSRSFVLCVC